MKRRLLAFMLVPALLALSGCHGTRGRRAFEVPETFDASRSYEITFWAKNDTNKTQTAIYQQAIESFQALYPGITVTMRLYTDYGKIYNDVITNIATDTTPNVCITYPDHIATYLTGDNVVAPLDALMDDPAYGLGGSESPSTRPPGTRSCPSIWRSAPSAATPTRCPSCAPPRRAMSIRTWWRRWATSCPTC